MSALATQHVRERTSGCAGRAAHLLAVVDPVLLVVDDGHVVAVAAVDLVLVALAGEDHVVAGPGADHVVPAATVQLVVARAADEDVVAAAAAQLVVATASVQVVVAGAAGQPVRLAGAVDALGPRRPDPGDGARGRRAQQRDEEAEGKRSHVARARRMVSGDRKPAEKSPRRKSK